MILVNRLLGRKIAIGCAVITLLIGLAVIAGWQFDIPTLKSVASGYITMKFNTALCFVIFASGLAYLATGKMRRLSHAPKVLVFLASLIGILTLAEYSFGQNFGIDEFIFKDPGSTGGTPPGRLAPVTALSFALMGAGVWLSQFTHRSRKSRDIYLGQLLLVVVALISFQALVGYGLGVKNSFGLSAHTQIALHTALAFILLSTGFLSLTIGQAYLRVLMSPNNAGITARRLIVSAICFPPLFSFFERLGESRGWYDQDFGALIKVIAAVVFFTIMAWRTSDRLFKAERIQRRSADDLRRKDADRQRLLNEQKLANITKLNEGRLKAIFESAMSGIVCLRRGSEIIDWNSRAEAIFGWREEEVLGKTLVEVISPPDRKAGSRTSLEFYIKNVATQPVPDARRPIELVAQRKTGEIFPIHVTISAIAFGDSMSHTAFIEDISEQKKTHLELIQTRQAALNAAQAKSEFLANMSHEIRTPLNGIIGMTKLLSKTELTDKQAEFVNTVGVSSSALLTIVNQILDLAKIESGKLQIERTEFELRSLIRSAISIVEFSAKLKGLTVLIEVKPEVPDYFVGDPSRIRQILLNLLNNAVKFTDLGSIIVRVGRASQTGDISVLLFEVIDHGIGIDDEEKSKLFQSFSQGDGSTNRKYGGTGLGLAISRQLVQMMGGNIDVESAKGLGARFFFDLPLQTSTAGQSLKAVISASVPIVSGHLLIAEDNPVNQRVAIEMVRLMGCTGEIASNGIEVIKSLSAQNFELILMDGQMPQMDGYEATRLIRNGGAGESNRDIPIIATTANAIRGDLEKCFEAGMNDYVSKPIIFEDFADKITKWLKRGRSVIEVTALDKLEELAVAGNKNLVQELVDLFRIDAPKMIANIKNAINKNDTVEMSRTSHNLKSTCASLGAMRMRDLSERLERSEMDSHPRDLTILADLLEREYELAVKGLDTYLSQRVLN